MSDNTADILNSIQSAFSELKSTNETRLAALEAKGSVDPLIEQKMDAINQTISDLEKKMARPSISAADAEEAEYKSAFNSWARKGIEIKAGETSVNTATPADGGVALPKIVEAGIYTQLQNSSSVRALSTVISISSPDYRILTQTGVSGAGWVGETASRPQTTGPQFAEITVPTGEVYANVFASQRSLDDLGFNVESFIADDIATQFAVMENAAFVTGDGSGKPAGFMAATGVTTVKTGLAAALTDATKGADFVINMIQSMSQPYRAGSAFFAATATVAQARTIKDANGAYMWQPSLIAGTPGTLGGYALYEDENMAAVAANSLPMVFANLKRGYQIVDRTNITLIRDPYSAKPFVSFYATKRVGGVVRDKKAFVHLKVAA